MENRKEQMLAFNQEYLSEDKSLKLKVYNYFYLILKSKGKINSIIISFLILLETVQFVSYAFDEPHLDSWKIKKNVIKYISIILGSVRISPLMRYVTFDNYLILLYCLLILVFIFCVLILFQILSNNSSTKKIRGIFCIRLILNLLSIFLYIPITELFLFPLNCKNGKIAVISNDIECGKDLYYLYVVLGIIGALLTFISVFFFLNFYFYPFYEYNNDRKLITTNDLILHVVKLIFVLKYIFIKNEYFSIAILLICSLFCVIVEIEERTYSNYLLKIVTNIRNISAFYAYFVLLLSKICYNSKINNIIYFLFFSYPLIICYAILKIKNEDINFFFIPDNMNDINCLLKKTRILMNLIDSEIEENNTLNKSSNKKKKKNSEIFLYGYIQNHIKTCELEECFLLKYLNNKGNYNFQKQCLLNFMSYHFNTIIKNYPKNSMIRIDNIHFNFTKQYNLNSVRTNLAELKKLNVNFQEEFIIYCLEKEIKDMDSKLSENGANGNMYDVEQIEQKYLKLKYLIENATKLYVEFWNIFAGNTTNLNITKLNTLGSKINNYLNEINTLWDKDLKNRNGDYEYQGIVLLYSKFMKEILWNKKKSEEISKQINNNYYYNNEARKSKIGSNTKIANIDSVLENQDCLVFANSNERGVCHIVQCSYSFLYFLGYEKKELIRKQIEILMPSIFVEGHKKMLEERIKKVINSQSSILDSSRNANKKQNFILLRNKIGYLQPMFSSFTIYDDNDYSNTYVIKGKLEPKDSKSVYAYYILTKPDFTIESISSSALNLGLSMDLLKKYLVKINILIRTRDDEAINFFEQYKEYEEEPKLITWVYPNVIYPKENNQRNKDVIIQDLITQSRKGKFYLQINNFKFSDDKILGFCFKLTEMNKKENTNINYGKLIPKDNHEIMFDLLNLSYIRTILVQKKSGLRNLRDKTNSNFFNARLDELKDIRKTRKVKKEPLATNGVNNTGIGLNVELSMNERSSMNDLMILDNSSEEDNKKKDVIISKEKLLELQGSDYLTIKNFIYSLQFHGSDVSLEKHRPSRERYSAGKMTEPLIKIEVSKFLKRIEEKILSNPNLFKKFRQSSIKTTPNDELSFANDEILNPLETPKKDINNNSNKDDLGKDMSDVSTKLSKLFDYYAINLFAIVSFGLYFLIIAFSIIEFVATYQQMNKIQRNLDFFNKATNLTGIVLYTKYFLTEAVISNKLNSSNIDYVAKDGMTVDEFNDVIKKELESYYLKFNEIYNFFNSNSGKLSKEYRDFMDNQNMTFYSLANDIPVNDTKKFSASLNKIPASLFYISTVNDQDNLLTMNSRNTYELMQNLLNEYIINWRSVADILNRDAKKSTNNNILTLILLILTLFLPFISVYFYYNVFINSDKPINLILTIKKKIFEDLKASAENFANKLLNKYFGNEENEEESHQDYQSNVQSNDINIVKFKSPTKSSYSCFSLFVRISQLTMFLIVVEIYFIFKYIYTLTNFSNMNNYIDVYSITEYTDSDIISTIDVVKSFMYNNSIPIYKDNSTIPFVDVFYEISDYIEKTVVKVSKTDCFLDGEYKDKFIQYLYGDFSQLLDTKINYDNYDIKNGFRPILSQIFEIIRYFEFLYLTKEEEYNTGRIDGAICVLINDENWKELNFIVKNILRRWFEKIETLMGDIFHDYMRKAKVVHTIIFVVLQCFLLLYYVIIWRRKFIEIKTVIQKSQELINLIPEEIKYIMVDKINE